MPVPLRRLIAAPALASLLLASVAGAGLAQTPQPQQPQQPRREAQRPPSLRKGVFFPETFTLGNGMQVVVVTNQRVPVITHMVWYKVGAADEMTGKSGIAHFLEHLMFKATDELKPGEFSRIVARNGGRDNAFTSWDYTAYFQNVAADRLELVMRMEADRMANLRLTDETLLPERDVIVEERRQRTENEPGDKLSELVQASLFVHHPYGTPVIGWEHEIRQLTRDDANEFYQRWYAPNNAVLVIAGDVTVDQVKPLAEKYFGPIAPRPVPARQRVEEPPFAAERRVILRDAEVRQPSLRRLYHAPSFNRGETKHAYPLEVLSEIVGGGATSRLYRSLVVEQQLATGAGTGYSPEAFDLSVFGAYVSPNPGVDMDKLEAALIEQLNKVVIRRRHAAGGRDGQDPDGARGDLRPRQPARTRHELRHGAGHRPHDRGCGGMAGADRLRDGRAGQCRRQSRARPDQPRHRPAAAGPRAGSSRRCDSQPSQPRQPAAAQPGTSGMIR